MSKVGRRAAKRDGNEPEIVKALISVGAQVERLDQPVDLLVLFRGQVYLLEIKDRSGRGRLQPYQAEFIDRWQGVASVVWSVDDALRFIGAID